jgi:hypothetical protein
VHFGQNRKVAKGETKDPQAPELCWVPERAFKVTIYAQFQELERTEARVSKNAQERSGTRTLRGDLHGTETLKVAHNLVGREHKPCVVLFVKSRYGKLKGHCFEAQRRACLQDCFEGSEPILLPAPDHRMLHLDRYT